MSLSPKQVFLPDIIVRVTCRNTSLNHSDSMYIRILFHKLVFTVKLHLFWQLLKQGLQNKNKMQNHLVHYQSSPSPVLVLVTAMCSIVCTPVKFLYTIPQNGGNHCNANSTTYGFLKKHCFGFQHHLIQKNIMKILMYVPLPLMFVQAFVSYG